jgi:rubrerythrin
MNAFEFAMKMELDGKRYYEEHETKTADPVLKKIFAELADDERKHYELFQAMAAGENPAYEAILNTSILKTTRNIFEKLSASKKEIGAFPAGFREAWVKAREIEAKSEAFYREQAQKSEGSGQKKIWIRIADEEHKHWVTIDSVIGFLDRPKQWLEDAEWSNLDPY